jgi:hypothetical protein
MDTARLAFGDAVQVLPALNSFFDDRSSEPAQTAALRAVVRRLPANENWMWVTHQVNISALTGVSPQQGEGIALRRAGDRLVPKFRWQV